MVRLTPEEYSSRRATANRAVDGVDATYRQIAADAIFESLVAGTPLKSYFDDPANCWCIGLSLGLAGLAVLLLWLKLPFYCSIIILACIDGGMGFLLWAVASHADGYGNHEHLLPHRLPALIMCGLLFIGLIHCFGNLYLNNRGISASGACCVLDGKPDAAIATPTEALYFSCVTMTTLGYGDFYANKDPARWVVMLQLGSSVLLLVLFLPLVVSRVASY